MNKSESIAKLAEALSKAQGEMTPAKRDSSNPFFKSKYADLASVWEVCRKPLASNGLAVAQLTRKELDGVIILETVLLHSSGEWVSSEYPVIPIKQDPQGLGSALTYARRYSLSSLLGIASEEDDDAEEAMGRKIPEKGKIIPKVEKPVEPNQITETQYKRILALAEEKGVSLAQVGKAYIKATFNKAQSKSLTQDEATQMIDDLESGKLNKDWKPKLVEVKLGATQERDYTLITGDY